MKVEIFYTTGCSACVAAHDELRTMAQQTVEGLDWQDVNVLGRIDYAVELGVVSLPSIVVDGELVFTSMPTTRALREALIARSGLAVRRCRSSMVTTYAVKSRVRYRYAAAAGSKRRSDGLISRIPAQDVEAAIIKALHHHLEERRLLHGRA